MLPCDLSLNGSSESSLCLARLSPPPAAAAAAVVVDTRYTCV